MLLVEDILLENAVINELVGDAEMYGEAAGFANDMDTFIEDDVVYDDDVVYEDDVIYDDLGLEQLTEEFMEELAEEE
jgi:hypothetical protein